MKRKLLSSLVVVILAASVYLLFGDSCLRARRMVSQPLLLPDGLPSLPGQRVIRIAYSPVMRAGETQTIEVNLTTEGDEEESRLYNDYNLIAEARLGNAVGGCASPESGQHSPGGGRQSHVLLGGLSTPGRYPAGNDLALPAIYPEDRGRGISATGVRPVDRDPFQVSAGLDWVGRAHRGSGWVSPGIGTGNPDPIFKTRVN